MRWRAFLRLRTRPRPPLAVLLLGALAAGCEKPPAIPNIPPVASFVYSPVSPINSGQTVVVFNASGSTDSDDQIASYTWNFGDGTPEDTRSTPTINHLFPDTPASCLEIVYTVLLSHRSHCSSW